ncbi:hypothetical protein MA786_004739 [Vibrio parahaemolyticus]|nr:hypothetical protein [Vibrio parahaemolyticus]EIV8641854.1 hypothetical protein [Vibrio parahaemolyticus]EIY6410491.1 hypothetical protein [Vibrio parahaemolyticus]EJB1765671.1 hypothetical protein [Vibrio parahaemolyticus]EJG1019227.1 hypothetical protein [Vibrio parahaemolyticus]
MELPHRDEDPLMILYARYYLASDLMYKNYRHLMDKSKKSGDLNRNDSVDMTLYFCSWVGFLGVTSEGFTKLIVRKCLKESRPSEFDELIPEADALGKLMNAHKDDLRRFRNTVFHMSEDVTDINRFFQRQPDRLAWAEELQLAFEKFFSSYRVLCQVHYAMNGRKSELL